ncbi:MAG: hypothetical protein RL628_53 [Actinomycetota bacterium]
MDTERTYGEVATRARDSFQGVERIPGARKQEPILTAHNIRREFGGIVAVDVDHFEVQKGSITALIGPNGAGKTTFFNLLTGFDQPNSGDWNFNGKAMNGVASHRTAALGMVRTFQLTKSLTKLSVIENMRLGATDQKGEKWWNGLFAAPKSLSELTNFLLDSRWTTCATNTPGHSLVVSANCSRWREH